MATSSFFKDWFLYESFHKRCKDSERVIAKHKDKLPVIVGPGSDSAPVISNHKFLVPVDMTVGHMMHMLRSRVHVKPDQALFLFVNSMTDTSHDSIPSNTQMIGQLYSMYRSEDGFLYIKYDVESTFG